MSGDRQTGEIGQKFEKRKKYLLMLFIGELAYVNGLLIGRYHEIIHEKWYAALPVQYFATPPESLLFLQAVVLNSIVAVGAFYMARWYNNRLENIQSIDGA